MYYLGMPRAPMIVKSILFALIGLCLVWLPIVDKIASDEAANAQAKARGKIYDWHAKKAVDLQEAISLPVNGEMPRPPVYELYPSLWATTLFASAGIVALVVLNHLLQKHRRRRHGSAPKA